jgi:hypothetical protein
LAHAAFEGGGIAGDGLAAPLGGLDRQGRFRLRAIAIEFFFEGRTPR